MWLNERARQTGGAGYECAGVTLGGSQVETVASAHLRETPVYAPYGYTANVPAGAQVLHRKLRWHILWIPETI